MKKDGITLIAVIITIIVLLILAGITINLIIGQEGIISKAQEAGIEHEKSQLKEELELAILDIKTSKLSQGKSMVRGNLKELENIGAIIDELGIPTYVEYKDYYFTIDEEYKVTIIGKTQGPKITNITITTDGTEVAEDKDVPIGTPLQINFEHSIKGGTTIVDKTLPYITDGKEQEVTFTITGIVNGQNYIKTIKVSVANKYRELYIADVVQIGDFINYTLGNWTEEDIQKIGNMYSGEELPTIQEKFGGFGISNSKDSGIKADKQTNTYIKYSNGWRVLSKNADGTINIMHSGTPEGYYHKVKGGDSGYRSQYILSGILSGDISTTDITKRDWSMYEDCSTNSVTRKEKYAIEDSAHCMIYKEAESLENSSLRETGIYYWLGGSYYTNKHLYYITADGRINGDKTNDGFGESYGIRPVVTLKSEIKVSANLGDTTHDTPETAWNLRF